FSGFLAPVSMTTLNVVKAGAGVPLKFSLGGDKGLGVIAPGYPTSTAIACSGAPTGSEITGASAGSSSLNYDASSGQYTYVWKTEKSWARSCRKLVMRFTDGTEGVALFNFK